MKLRQLQCLCAIVDAGFNLSRAASTLHTTQPAVSKQLRHLEEELGLDLLHRHGGRVLGLTEIGERTAAWARQALQCVDNIRDLAQESRGGTTGRIVVATSHTQAKYALLPALPAYRRHRPGVKIAVRQGSPEQVLELVREGKASFGLISLIKDGNKEVVALPLRSSPLVLIATPGHPLLEGPTPTLAQLAQHPLVLVHPSAMSLGVMARFEEAGLEIEVAVQALNSDMAKDFVVAGMGYALIPAFTHDPVNDHRLQVRDVGDLFDPVVTSVALRRNGHVLRYVHDLLELIDPTLDRHRLDALVFSQ